MQLRPRRTRRTTENVVPLINVVFLLLVFFMLTGTLAPPSPLEVELPRAEGPFLDTEPDPDTPVLTLSASGVLALAGDPLTGPALSRRDLVEALGAGAVALRADARTPARILLPLLDDLEQAGVAQIDLVIERGH